MRVCVCVYVSVSVSSNVFVCVRACRHAFIHVHVSFMYT